MITLKKLSVAIAGAVVSGLCLGMEAASAQVSSTEPSPLDYEPLVLPSGAIVSFLSPRPLDGSVFVAGQSTNGLYSIIDGGGPRADGPTPHRHFTDDEAFYIKQGRVAYLLNDQTFVADAGDFVFIPRGSLHAWRSIEPFNALILSNPADLLGYLEALRSGPGTYLDNFVNFAPDYASEVVDSLFFDKYEYTINEDGTPTVAVTVNRIGNTEEPASATIVLSHGSATLGEDYSNTEIPIRFAPQQTVQTVEIPIPLIDDDLSEGNETINLTLTNPSGKTIIAPLQSRAVLSILDDNIPPTSDSSNITLSAQELQELYGWPTLQQSRSQIQSFWLGGGTADVVATSNDTNNQYSLFDVLVPPETGFQQYTNFRENNGFYLLEGNVSFKIDDQTITLDPGNFIYTPASLSYEFGNLSTTPSRIALFSTPSASVPEPSIISGLLVLVACSAVSLRKNKQYLA